MYLDLGTSSIPTINVENEVTDKGMVTFVVSEGGYAYMNVTAFMAQAVPETLSRHDLPDLSEHEDAYLMGMENVLRSILLQAIEVRTAHAAQREATNLKPEDFM